MRNIFLIITFTILQTIKKKVFLVSNVIIAAFIIVCIFIIGNKLSNLSLSSNEEDSHPIVSDITDIIIIDKGNILNTDSSNISTGNYNFIFKDISEIDTIKEKILNDEITYAIILEPIQNTNNINLNCLCKNRDSLNNTQLTPISEALKNIQYELLLDSNIVSSIYTPISFDITSLSNSNINVQKILSTIVSFVLFMSIYLYGHSIASSVSSEKISRVIETLVVSAKPKYIVIGKTIGMGILGLLQIIFLIAVTVFSYNLFIPTQMDIVSLFMSQINISIYSVLLILVFFILGYLLYAFANAILGAIISKPEDLQMVTIPLSFITLLSFYLAIFPADYPTTDLGKFAVYFPFSTAFAVPSRVLIGTVNIGEIGASILILLICVLLLAFISIRIYSNVILYYGNKIKFKDLFNIFIGIK